MRYNDVLAYVNERRASFNSFRLPAQLLSNPANKLATIAENCKECVRMNSESCTFPQDGDTGRIIEPIPYTSESEKFSV